MKLCLLVLFALVLAGCSPVCPYPSPWPEGGSCIDTCGTDPTKSRSECVEICGRDECQDDAAPRAIEDEATAIGREALTHAASRVYAISSLYYQAPGCAHGAIASDSASRCNSPIETLFARIPTDACPPGATPTLSFQITEWHYNVTVDIRRVLRSVVDPPAGISSACADQYPGAKWDVTGAGESWTTPGAKGIGTDVSAEKASFTATPDGPTNLQKTVDLRLRDEQGNLSGGTLLDACAPSGECLFAFFASAHIWEAPGSFMLAMTCASPPAVCGDGTIGGAEQCDDGLSPAAGDGCSAACTVETGWTCSGTPSSCLTACGDGVKAGAEQCDDGNVVSHDGCSATCVVEVCNWQ